MKLCTDWDLIVREPGLVRSCRGQAHLVATGYGQIDGMYLRTGDDWLVNQGAQPTMLVYVPATGRTGVLAEQLDGNTFRTIVPHAGLGVNAWDYAFEPPEPGLGNSPGTQLQVYTFPQIGPASFEVSQRLGLPLTLAGDEFNRVPLRTAVSFRALSAIFRSMSAMDQAVNEQALGFGVALSYNARYADLADWYDREFAREFRRLRVPVDLNGDGKPDLLASRGVVDTQRR